jgi:hypothetical protein
MRASGGRRGREMDCREEIVCLCGIGRCSMQEMEEKKN